MDYENFLNELCQSNKIDSLTTSQKRKLINEFNVFPYGKTIILSLGETIKFEAETNQAKNQYIHHFLTKNNNGKDWYSENYLHLVNDIVTNLSQYDERFLILRNNSERICYAKHTPNRGKKAYHIIACKLLPDKHIIAWTHFDAKHNYLHSLRKEEEQAIKDMGLIDKENNNIIVKDYDEFQSLKRKTPLYLGSGVLSKLHKS
jgi:hypothetical protein